MADKQLFDEYEITGATGKYPKEAFTAIFKGYEYTENDNKTKELKLKFDKDTYITIYGRGKLNANGNATGRLADYLNSLLALNVRNIAVRDGDALIALRHDPDIINCKMTIEPFIEKTRGDDTQNKDSIWWGKVTHIILDTPVGSPKPKPPAPTGRSKTPVAASKSATNEDLAQLVSDAIDLGATNIMQMRKDFENKYSIKELREALPEGKTSDPKGNIIEA